MSNGVMAIRLKETSLLTEASWAAWLESDVDGWALRAGFKVNRRQAHSLLEFLSRTPNKIWLNGALAGKHNRTRRVPPASKLEGKRIYVFPDPVTQRVIMVGADELTSAARRVWRVVAIGNSGRPVLEDRARPTAAETSPGSDIPFYLPQALDQVLENAVRMAGCQGGWLAIRSGEAFEVKVASGGRDFSGKRLAIDANPLLREICQSQAAVVVARDQLEWAMVPRANFKPGTAAWGAVPMVIGRRLIGLICLWKDAPFDASPWDQAVAYGLRIAPMVEGSIAFADIANQLQRMAILNDFALTVSSAIDLEQIVKRIFALLQRAFQTERIFLTVLAPNQPAIYHYVQREGAVLLESQLAENLPVLRMMETEEIFRADVIAGLDGYVPIYPGSRACLAVPLKYQRQRIGVLGLESETENGFSVYDEHLLVVIASHLAGLIENGRLRQEAETRARNMRWWSTSSACMTASRSPRPVWTCWRGISPSNWPRSCCSTGRRAS